MWTEWFHLGVLSVEIECSLVAADVDRFARCVQGHPSAFQKIAEYAALYVGILNTLTYESISDISTDELRTAAKPSGWRSMLTMSLDSGTHTQLGSHGP